MGHYALIYIGSPDRNQIIKNLDRYTLAHYLKFGEEKQADYFTVASGTGLLHVREDAPDDGWRPLVDVQKTGYRDPGPRDCDQAQREWIAELPERVDAMYYNCKMVSWWPEIEAGTIIPHVAPDWLGRPLIHHDFNEELRALARKKWETLVNQVWDGILGREWVTVVDYHA